MAPAEPRHYVEISVPDGTLTDPFARRLDRLLVDVFGWVGTTATVQHPTLGPTVQSRTYTTSGPAVVLRQATVALQPGIEDHIGFAVDPDELERLLPAASSSPATTETSSCAT